MLHIQRITQFLSWTPELHSSSKSMTASGMAEQGVGLFLGVLESVWNLSREQKSKASPRVRSQPQNWKRAKRSFLLKGDLSLWYSNDCTRAGFYACDEGKRVNSSLLLFFSLLLFLIVCDS